MVLMVIDCFGQRPCNLFCNEHQGEGQTQLLAKGSAGSPGKIGPRGLRGEKGERGDICGCNCSEVEGLHEKLKNMISK